MTEFGDIESKPFELPVSSWGRRQEVLTELDLTCSDPKS